MRTNIICVLAFMGSIFIFFVACSKGGSGSAYGGGTPTGGGATSTSSVTVSTLANANVFNPGPTGIALDAQGNIYVSSNNYLIYKVTPVGTVSNYVGKPGTAGCGNGTGDTATLTDPFAICTDAQNNIYVADIGCMSIKKVSPGAVATTFISTNPGNNITIDGPQTIAIDPQGNIYSADPMGQDGITMVTPGGAGSHLAGTSTSGYKDGDAASAEFLGPTGLAADGQGNVYVADGNRIRKISGGQVSTLAGSQTAGFADGTGTSAAFGGPMGLCVDSKGNIYVADTDNNRIRMVTPAGVVTTVAGSGTAGTTDGSASSAQFNKPTNLCIDGQGNLFTADFGNGLIRKITFN